ncbi:MAG TPA: class F sortase [Negativicutes bacterium]|nr:class F sortase [Negativicutes bacterium]
MKQHILVKRLLLFGAALFFGGGLLMAGQVTVAGNNGQASAGISMVSLGFSKTVAPVEEVAVPEFVQKPGLQSATMPSTPISLPAASVPVGKPVRFSIPAISVNAKVEHIGLTADGAVGVTEGAKNVSWFSAGPRPGEQGSAVISGHTGIWRNGTSSVFDRLHTIRAGEKISVTDQQGTVRTFIVQETRVYGKDEVVPEIFNQSGKAYLNIITCHGQYLPSQQTYSQRFVVFAVLQ